MKADKDEDVVVRRSARPAGMVKIGNLKPTVQRINPHPTAECLKRFQHLSLLYGSRGILSGVKGVVYVTIKDRNGHLQPAYHTA